MGLNDFDYKKSLNPKDYDSVKGSLRKITALLGAEAGVVADTDIGKSTNADSATYQALPSQEADSVFISNLGLQDIFVRYVGKTAGDGFTLSSGLGKNFPVTTNISEVEWKRVDGAAVTYDVEFQWEKV